jgi:hypothetical protein
MELVSKRDALATYRYLRIAMPVLVIMLGTSVMAQIFAPSPDCWLGSISAYYYTSARAVFVACLCAIGACLVIYHGNTSREDFALNVSGFLALVVAFVPTPLNGLSVSPNEPSCKRSNVPSESQLGSAIDNNMLALLVAATVVACVAVWFRKRPAGAGGVSAALLILCAVLLLSWVMYLFDRSFVRAHGHLISALVLFGGIVTVVILNAVPWQVLDPKVVRAPEPYLLLYRVILGAMAAAIVILGAVALWGHFDHAIFWLEASVIVLFAAFWVVQSKELWGLESRE